MSEDTINQLKNVRRSVAAIQAEMELAEASLKEHPLYKRLEELKSALKDCKDAESTLRDALLDEGMLAFKESGNKRPITGVQVKEFKTVEITDGFEARRWLSTNAPDALNIDTKKVSQIAEVMPLPFAVVGTEYRPNLVEKDLKDE